MHEVCNQQNVAGPFVTILPHGIPLWFGDVKPVIPVVGDAGVADIDAVGDADGPGMGIPRIGGETVGVGTAKRGLTPALPISTDPIGIPGRETALGDIKGPESDNAVVPEGDPQGVALPVSPVPDPIPPRHRC
jgi:hypothetical protein